ncbi:P-loop containing nucleoside triphosphate hydrolase protein [Trichoderma chlorosporum]
MRGTVRWLLLSDLHFRHLDPDRTWQTARWIVDEAKRHRVKRAVICGDLLTSRNTQLTHVLSSCYRFVGLLSDVVPRVHILLGNHDLSYRRDYQTTALDALSINRLAPYVSLHSGIAHHEWDGRRVLILPFREDQDELAAAVDSLDPSEARKTVAFAHLAINKAITQRYVVDAGISKPRTTNSITYRGLMGPERFASLARTFTGHFHSHQTIRNHADLQGSITYLGSPLQLSWADLNDQQRGAVLFDPETLEHELLINPHAVHYTTADLQQVLDGQVDAGAVAGKHVMLVGELSLSKYTAARDRLTSQFKARSVRKWTPAGFTYCADQTSFGGLGASVPESDAPVQRLDKSASDDAGQEATSGGVSDSDAATDHQITELDLAEEARNFVESLQLDEALLLRRDKLVLAGQRIFQVSREREGQDGDVELDYRDFIDPSRQVVGTKTATELVGSSTHVFVAEPRALTITNFLGVQGTITVDFRKDLPRGLTFFVGDNGSGKSTLIEAMVWCQFGQCIRGKLSADEVVNDSAAKNCSVTLEFANGYTITRHRKHKSYGKSVIVSLHGIPQPQFERADLRDTQKAIDKELLNTNFETYVKTVVMSHESAASFLNSKSEKRRDMIETSVGLSILDHCRQVSKSMLEKIDEKMGRVESEMDALFRNIEDTERRLKDWDRKRKRQEQEVQEAALSLEAAIQKHSDVESQVSTLASSGDDKRSFSRQDVEILSLQNQVYTEQENLQRLQKLFTHIQKQKHAEPKSWLAQLLQQINQKLGLVTATRPVGLQKLLHAAKVFVLRFRLMVVRGLLRASGSSQEISIRNNNQRVAISSLREDIESSKLQLQNLKSEANRIIALEELAINNASMIKEQLTRVIKAQKACEVLEQQVTLKQSEAAVHMNYAKEEQSLLPSLRSEHDTLKTTLEELAADRELFKFWTSALAKRTPRASLSSSTKSTTKATANFRDYVLGKTLTELNELVAQVLTMLYDDTRHARDMATGMLRSLLDSDSDSVDTAKDLPHSAGSVLGRTLAVNPSLAYGKRSSGERKRIDLALYFALLQLTWARSAHRAHYLLVDEVFDSLDEAGQAAVVRWCGLMSQTVGWVVVITHSRFLVDRDLGEDTDRPLVVRAKMGKKGTELEVDGRRIGVRDEH